MSEENFNPDPANSAAQVDAVNFDALSAPEGSYDPFIHGDGAPKTEGSGDAIPAGNYEEIVNGLPNLDPKPERNENVNGDQDLGDQQQNTNQNNNQNQNQDLANQANPATGNEYWMKPFEQLKTANPDWEIPQGINEDNYLQYLQKIFEPEVQVHPELIKMQEAIDQGVKFEDIVKEYKNIQDVNSLSDREVLASKFKESYKDWSDDKINEVLNKMENSGLIEIEAGRHRKEINEQQSTALDNMRKNVEQQSSQDIAKINEERSKQINDSLKHINSANDIYGLPISQSEKAEFSEYFAKLVTPDNTGMAPMFQMLQSNETLAKVAMMLWKGDDKIRAALTNAKEAGKNAILGKLDPKPNNVQRSGGGGQDSMQIDFDALSAPERLM
jgi:hypothetical protein